MDDAPAARILQGVHVEQFELAGVGQRTPRKGVMERGLQIHAGRRCLGCSHCRQPGVDWMCSPPEHAFDTDTKQNYAAQPSTTTEAATGAVWCTGRVS